MGCVFLNNSDQDFKRIFRRDDKTESLEPSRAMKISQFAENIPCFLEKLSVEHMGEKNKKKIRKCYRCQISLRSKFGVENRTRKEEDLVDRAAEIKHAEGSCSTHSDILGVATLKS